MKNLTHLDAGGDQHVAGGLYVGNDQGRVELLSQYMYLISAPFLAIVAYYMMGLLGFTKLPILVLISFSVGLISEKILNWLLSLTSSYIKSDTSESMKSK